ncbi:MAG: hypothetical protein NTY77_18225 [Elusimicrobia bacterium]|nr:hypothetical protein [Elusimicrobiota bacterium]
MKASIVRALVMTMSLTVLAFLGVSTRNAYAQGSGGGAGCCGGGSAPETQQPQQTQQTQLSCAKGTHQVGDQCVANQ